MGNKTKYALIDRIRYLGKKTPGTFEAGFVKFSAHKQNTVYLQIPPDFLFEFTDDEAMAIINVLSFTLWQKGVGLSRKKRKAIKWIEKEKYSLDDHRNPSPSTSR